MNNRVTSVCRAPYYHFHSIHWLNPWHKIHLLKYPISLLNLVYSYCNSTLYGVTTSLLSHHINDTDTNAWNSLFTHITTMYTHTYTYTQTHTLTQGMEEVSSQQEEFQMDESGKYPKTNSQSLRVRVIMIGYDYIILKINSSRWVSSRLGLPQLLPFHFGIPVNFREMKRWFRMSKITNLSIKQDHDHPESIIIYLFRTY